MDEYHSEVKKVLMIVLILNIIMASLKIAYGTYAGILSVSADGFDSLLDAVANIAGVVAISIASRPIDKHHPYGYDKIETFASILIGVSLIVVSYEILQQSFEKLINPQPIEITSIGFVIIIASLVINILLSRYEKKKSKEYNSDLLLADSEHTKSDVLVTSLVLVGLVLMYFDLAIIDPIISFLITILIIKTGVDILKSNFDILIDSNVIPTANIYNIVNKVEGVENVHNIRTRGTTSSVYVDMHVVVNSDLSVRDAHHISKCCEENIKNAYSQVKEVLIRLESEEGLDDVVELE